MADSVKLNTVLSGLYTNDLLLKGKLGELSGHVKTAFTADKVAVGSGTGLSASTYEIGTTTSGTFGTASKLATEAGAKEYVDTKLAALQGDALTGVAVDGAALSASEPANNSVTIALKTDNLTIGQDAAGLKSLLTLTKKTSDLSGYASVYELKDASGNVIGDSINIFKDQFLSGASYDATTEEIVLDFVVASPAGTDSAAQIKIPVSGLVHEFEGVSGVAIDFNANGNTSQIKGVVDPASETFFTVGAAGFKLSGVQDAINAKAADATAGLTALSAALTGYLSGEAVKNEFTAVDGRLDTIEGALTDYLSGNAVKNEFTAVDGRLDNLETKTSATIATDNLVKWNGTSYADAGLKIGSDSTASGSFGADTTAATEKAAKAYTDGAVAVLSSAADAAYIAKIGNAGIDNHVVLFNTNGDVVKDGGRTVGADDQTAANFGGTGNVLATEAAVATYVTDGLDALNDAIDALKLEIQAL